MMVHPSLAVVLYVLAGGRADNACHAEGGVCTSNEEDPGVLLVELLQTGLHIGLPRARADSLTLTKTADAVNLSTASFEAACKPWAKAQYTPLQLQLQLGILHHVGFISDERALCGQHRMTMIGRNSTVRHLQSNVAVLGTGSNVETLLKADSSSIWKTLTHLPFVIYLLAFYFAVVIVIIFYMLYTVVWRPQSSVEQGRSLGVVRPEAESWKKGFLSWVCVSWATPWVARWGNDEDPNSTKIKHQDLGYSGSEVDEAAIAVEDWWRLWKQDTRRRGERVCNMYLVVLRFCTFRKIAALTFASAVYEILMFLAPAFAVDWTLNYMEKLQELRRVDPEAATLDKQVAPIFVILGFFTGLPLLMAVFNTVAAMISLRMNVRLQAALTAAVYQKAQRLPVTGGKYNLVDPEDDAENKSKGDGSYEHKDQSYSLVQLINTDVTANLLNFQSCVSKLIIMIPILITLTVVLLVKMGRAMIFAALAAFTISFLLIYTARMTVIRLRWYQFCAGARLTFLQEVLYAIRMVKSNAWEPCLKVIVAGHRQSELTQLSWFFFWTGCTTLILIFYPKVVIVCGLAGYVHVYDTIRAADVFIMMQILTAFKGAAQTIMALLPELINFGPSIRRIDRMLKLPESPFPGAKAAALTADKSTSYLHLWPEDPKSDPTVALRIQGSFNYNTGETALRDLDITVKQGELVALLGEVGSGKSTLLNALLGELHATKDSKLEIPGRLAYHGQVPLICEATLKENVIYWGELDEERYKKAIYGACLLPDLEILPGGDMVPIGSRGISLSGGQRARVSLARAAYASNADVVLVDDPFASVDQPTGKHLMEKLLLGDLMRGRTRVVVCQPDRHRLLSFDKVFILAHGRVCAQGTPEEIFETNEYKVLLSHFEMAREEPPAPVEEIPATEGKVVDADNDNTGGSDTGPGSRPPVVELREEEHQGRADRKTLKVFCSMGMYRNLIMVSVFMVTTIVLIQFSDMVCAKWANTIMEESIGGVAMTPGGVFIRSQMFWAALGMGCTVIYWAFGSRFTLNISTTLHDLILDRLSTAPIDRFWDKTPVGRVMNRVSADQTAVDLQMYLKFIGCATTFVIYLVPMIYVHCVMPFYLLMGAIPFYYLLYSLVKRYWNTMVPLRYLNSVTRSHVNAYITEVENGCVSARAYQVSAQMAVKQMTAVDHMLKAMYANSCISRWVCNRILIMYSFFCTVVAVIGVVARSETMIGTLGLCITNICLVIMQVENYLLQMTEAQFQFISMNRLQEYTELPQERAHVQPTDFKYYSPVISLPRYQLGNLQVRREGSRLRIVRKKPNGDEEPLLEQSSNGEALVPTSGKNVGALDPTCLQLQYTTPWHRVHAVNGIVRDCERMAEELCTSNSQSVWLSIRSGWMIGGAKVTLTDLVVGYADMPQDVLKGISVTIEPKSKTAIAGTTGCGKSTMILSLLRMLEPRSGKIEINGVDTQSVGLGTLRSCLGLVPQDPVLFTGSLRNNMDPFSNYTDDEVWNSLRAVQLADWVRSYGSGLDFRVTADGENFSFGQKQLLCIARQILRAPELLMLDECTSAIDPHNQELVQNTIRTSFPDSTLVAIAHRLETILDFDAVIVMSKGRIVEKGSVKELRAMNGFFAKMLAAKGM